MYCELLLKFDLFICVQDLCQLQCCDLFNRDRMRTFIETLLSDLGLLNTHLPDFIAFANDMSHLFEQHCT